LIVNVELTADRAGAEGNPEIGYDEFAFFVWDHPENITSPVLPNARQNLGAGSGPNLISSIGALAVAKDRLIAAGDSIRLFAAPEIPSSRVDSLGIGADDLVVDPATDSMTTWTSEVSLFTGASVLQASSQPTASYSLGRDGVRDLFDRLFVIRADGVAFTEKLSSQAGMLGPFTLIAGTSGAVAIAVNGTRLFVLGGSTLTVFDLSTAAPSGPPSATISGPVPYATEIVAANDLIVVTSANGEIAMLRGASSLTSQSQAVPLGMGRRPVVSRSGDAVYAITGNKISVWRNLSTMPTLAATFTAPPDPPPTAPSAGYTAHASPLGLALYEP
jgi:hypothetical protein